MRRRELLAALPLTVTAAGCTVGEAPDDDGFTFSIPPFDDGEIPERYTCDGAGESPPFEVDGVPSDVESIALVGEWLSGTSPGTIWLLWNVAAESRIQVPSGLEADVELDDPANARQGTNDEGEIGYRPPCHETPDDEQYRFSVLALETTPALEGGANRDDFDDAVEANVLASESVIATYERF